MATLESQKGLSHFGLFESERQANYFLFSRCPFPSSHVSTSQPWSQTCFSSVGEDRGGGLHFSQNVETNTTVTTAFTKHKLLVAGHVFSVLQRDKKNPAGGFFCFKIGWLTVRMQALLVYLKIQQWKIHEWPHAGSLFWRWKNYYIFY